MKTPAQRRAALSARFPVWTPKPIHEWFFDSAEQFGDREFVVTDERSITYRQMREYVESLAAGLFRRGIRKGDHVAVVMANYPELIMLKYAISRLGAVIVPLNFLYKRDELAFVLRNSEAKCLITMTAFRDLDYLSMLDEIVPGWEHGGADPALPDLDFIVQFEAMAPAREGVASFNELMVPGDRLPADAPQASADDASIMFYTSGSTGNPKGVLWRHDQDARVGFGSAMSRAFDDGWRAITALPFFHAMANNEVLNSCMFVGGAVIPRVTFNALDMFTAIERHRPLELVAVPTMVISLCELAGEPDREFDCSSLFGLMAAGSALPSWFWKRAIEVLGVSEVNTGYGQTETGAGQVSSWPEDGVDLVSWAVGRIKFAGVAGMPERSGQVAEMRTADRDTGEFLPMGEEGEIISRGPINSLSYWKLPEATAETFRDGWVFSGDIGRVTADGIVSLTGRKKEMIRSGGENYSPKEVEDLLTTHASVNQAFVVGIPDDKWGEIGCAWVVPTRGAEVNAAELEALCRANLANFKRPRQFRTIAVEELPTTPTGKIQKFRLVDRAIAEPLQRSYPEKGEN